MYCSYFSYCEDNKTRGIFCTGKPYDASNMINLLNKLAQQKLINPESAKSLENFFKADDSQQRNLFDVKANEKEAQMIIRAFFDVIEKVKSEDMLI